MRVLLLVDVFSVTNVLGVRVRSAVVSVKSVLFVMRLISDLGILAAEKESKRGAKRSDGA